MADAVKCDNCGAFAEADPFDRFLFQGQRRPLPKGWVRWFACVYPTTPDVSSDFEAELCGLPCMAAHSARVAVAWGPAASDETRTLPNA